MLDKAEYSVLSHKKRRSRRHRKEDVHERTTIKTRIFMPAQHVIPIARLETRGDDRVIRHFEVGHGMGIRGIPARAFGVFRA